MSRDNVELVLAAIPRSDMDLAAILRDDALWRPLQAAADLHPEFECVQNLFGGRTVYAGPEAVREMLRDWFAPWASYRIEIEAAVDCGDRVLVTGRAFGRQAADGSEVTAEIADVWTVRDGKIARWEAFENRVEAFEAVGLEG